MGWKHDVVEGTKTVSHAKANKAAKLTMKLERSCKHPIDRNKIYSLIIDSFKRVQEIKACK